MKRTDIINHFIKKYNYFSYLEIGVFDPSINFDKIDAKQKTSVDPFPRGEVTFLGTSNEFFASLNENELFDIIFIDGLHLSEQVLLDIQNSLKHLSPEGTIICHDCLPSTENMQMREGSEPGEWTGDVWKTLAELRINSTDLEIFVIDTDYGCGVIKRGHNLPYNPKNENYLSYTYYDENKFEMLNVISIDKFMQYVNS